jgi:CHAT domain-containing protein/tetratricopeptide (TPR) repeat protein
MQFLVISLIGIFFIVGVFLLSKISIDLLCTAYFNYAGMKLLRRERLKDAYIEFQKAIEIGGTNQYRNWETLKNLGLLYEKLGNYPKSIQYYVKALNVQDPFWKTILFFFLFLLIAAPLALIVLFRSFVIRVSQLTKSDKKLLLTSIFILLLPLTIVLLFLIASGIALLTEGSNLFEENLILGGGSLIFIYLICFALTLSLIIEIIQVWDQTYKRNQIFLLTIAFPYMLLAPVLILAFTMLFRTPSIIIYFIPFLFIVRIRRQKQEKLRRGRILCDLGRLNLSLGQYSKSSNYFGKALKISREIHNIVLEGDALSGLGFVDLIQGSFYRSLEYFSQAKFAMFHINEHQKFEPVRYGEALVSLGVNYTRINQPHHAFEYYLEALKFADDQKSISLKKLALLYQGISYGELNSCQKAVKIFDQVLEGIEDIGLPAVQATAMHHKASNLYQLGNSKEATRLLYSTISILEFLRSSDLGDAEKISIFEIQVKTYQFLQQVLIDQGEFNQALEVSERGRNRALLELLVQRISPAEFDNFLYSKTIQSPSLATIRQIAETHQATLIEYSLSESNLLYAWIIKPTGDISFRRIDLNRAKVSLNRIINRIHGKIVPKKLLGRESVEEYELAVENLIQDFYDNVELSNVRDNSLAASSSITVAQNHQYDVAHSLQQLYQLLIEPIADLLPSNPNEHIIFIPQDVLFLVPFAALQDENGQYLIEKHTILTAPSIQALDLTHQRCQNLRTSDEESTTKNTSEYLIVGNPTMPEVGNPPKRLSFLNGSEQEAIVIARLLETQAMIGDQATETEVIQRMKTAQLIHLATHGLHDWIEGGVPGAIALAPCAERDGLLTPNDILDPDLNLQCEMVVLSCCKTGRGEITGDGVVGLSRAFMAAGAPSVVASLWSIPDAPTASLMTEFYQNWQNGLDKAQALRQAMLTTMQTHPHPRDWAAFTLIGEADQ